MKRRGRPNRSGERRTILPASNSCGKIAYRSRAQAQAGKKLTPGDSLRPYLCPTCGLYHLGHNPRAVVRGVMSADAWYARRGQRREGGEQRAS